MALCVVLYNSNREQVVAQLVERFGSLSEMARFCDGVAKELGMPGGSCVVQKGGGWGVTGHDFFFAIEQREEPQEGWASMAISLILLDQEDRSR